MSENEEVKENKEEEDEEEEILSIPPEGVTDINDPELKEKAICDFIIKQVIGEGTFATVRLAINKQTGEQVAIKIMEKSRIVQKEDKIRIEREIKVLKNLRHPNIVHLYNVIETEEKIYLIMEYAKGKELFDYIVMKKKLTENESCIFFQQIISGIEYLHKIKYVHRDIKPENLLVNEQTKELKIVDFGLSNVYSNPNKNLLSSACGSPSYAAPEMLNGEKYKAPPVDIWSSGIVLYAMICGYLPFEDDDNEVLYDKICKGKFVIPNHVSEKARDLLNKILVTDPKKRLTIYQIKHHPWFSLYNDKGKLMINDGLILNKFVVPIDEEVVSSMSKKFNITEENIRISILSNKHDDISTLYYLLLNNKINNKKKSVADIKSDLFKKYCENKFNLFENYDKDLNKVLEDRKNGYNHQNLSQTKDVSSIDIKRKLNFKEENLANKKNIEDNKSNRKELMNEKRARYFSPQKKENKTNNINTQRELNKTCEKRNIIKFRTNNIVLKTKKAAPINDNENNDKNIKKPKMLLTERKKNKNKIDKKETQEKGNIKTAVESKKNKNEQIKDNNEENNEKRNLIKHREKKVHYEQKKDKYINYNKKNINLKKTSNIKNKNDIKTLFNGSQIKNENQKNRIKSAMIDSSVNKKKEKNDLNVKDTKKSVNIEMIHNSRMKNNKKNIKSKSIEENIEYKDKDNISKFNSCKTPIKNLNNNKVNIKSKLVIPLDKNKTYELSERADKTQNLFNKTGEYQKNNQNILLSEKTKKSKPKMNINKKKEHKNKNTNKNEEQQKLISFNTNTNNISQDTYNKMLENRKINKIKNSSSYAGKKRNNKLVKNIDNNNEKRMHNKFHLIKESDIPILENEDNELNQESISKIDEDSIIVSNKNLNFYEPFDLSFAYIRPRKTLKEEVMDLLEKHKMKYKSVSNTKFMIELKKEDVILCVKFDKLNIINDDNDKDKDNDNNIRISVIKIKILKGNYQSDINAFEKILYKLN